IDIYAEARSVRPWPDKERLTGEKETLGLWISGHPFDEYDREIRRFARTRIADLRADKQGSQLLAGLIVDTRTMKTKRGDTMAFLQLDDRSARIELVLYGEAYQTHRELLVKDNIIIVEGTVAHDDYSGGLSVRVKEVRSLLQARQSYASELRIELHHEMVNERFTDELEQLLSGAGGGACPVALIYGGASSRARVRLGQRWQVLPSDELLQSLRDRVGGERVSLQYP
ncbi:MAG: OB-fold nucleic acid binding domain-containing protein, partial [Halioglobus sp.]